MTFLHPEPDELRLEWRTLMILGCLLLAAGELALCCVRMGPASAASGPLGLVLLGAGLVSVVLPARHSEWPGRVLESLAAAVYFAAGLWLVFVAPERATAVMPLLGACFVAGGVLRMQAALTDERQQRAWAALSGGASVTLGLLMWSAGADAGIEALGEFAGLGLVVSGLSYLALAWAGWGGERLDGSAGQLKTR